MCSCLTTPRSLTWNPIEGGPWSEHKKSLSHQTCVVSGGTGLTFNAVRHTLR